MKSEWQVTGDINDFRGVWGLPLPPVNGHMEWPSL